MKLNKLTGITAKNGAMADILIKDGYAVGGDAYILAKVPIKTEDTPDGVYRKGYFNKPILSIEGKTIFYGDETKSPEIEPANLGVDYYPDIDKVIPKDGNTIQLDVAKLKKLLGVFTEQGVPFIDIHVTFNKDTNVLENKKPLKITGSGVIGVIMPMITDNK